MVAKINGYALPKNGFQVTSGTEEPCRLGKEKGQSNRLAFFTLVLPPSSNYGGTCGARPRERLQALDFRLHHELRCSFLLPY